MDETGQPPLYHVIYSDGNEEDFDRGELLRGYELFGAMALGTYKPFASTVVQGSSEEEAASEDAWSDDSDHDNKVKRKAKQRKRKASPTKTKSENKAKPKKRLKQTKLNEGVLKVKKGNVKSTFSVADVLTAWTDTTDYGASFRSLNEAEQKKELAQINLGAAKGIKGADKTKVLKAQYKDLMANKMKEYIQGNMVKANDMFRANVVSYRAAQILRPGFLSVGEWVEVDADRTPGWNSEGGIAVIINVHDNFADVK